MRFFLENSNKAPKFLGLKHSAAFGRLKIFKWPALAGSLLIFSASFYFPASALAAKNNILGASEYRQALLTAIDGSLPSSSQASEGQALLQIQSDSLEPSNAPASSTGTATNSTAGTSGQADSTAKSGDNNPAQNNPAQSNNTAKENNNYNSNQPASPAPAPTTNLSAEELQAYLNSVSQSQKPAAQQNNASAKNNQAPASSPAASQSAPAVDKVAYGIKLPEAVTQQVPPEFKNAASALWVPLSGLWVTQPTSYAYLSDSLKPHTTKILYGLSGALVLAGLLLFANKNFLKIRPKNTARVKVKTQTRRLDPAT